MISVGAAFVWFPDKPDREALRLFHETMLYKAECGMVLAFQEFYGNIQYFHPDEFPSNRKALSIKQLKKAQDELRRRYNFDHN